VLKVRKSKHNRITIDADVSGRRIRFYPMVLADLQGRPRIGWAYAATIAGAQGMTVDHATVLLDPSLTRHDCLVAASRARQSTTLVVDVKGIDRRLMSDLPLDRQRDDLTFSQAQRCAWLGERLSRASPKISTLEVADLYRSWSGPARPQQSQSLAHHR
jgi:Viral (Superfamily 1) RNA helicase